MSMIIEKIIQFLPAILILLLYLLLKRRKPAPKQETKEQRIPEEIPQKRISLPPPPQPSVKSHALPSQPARKRGDFEFHSQIEGRHVDSRLEKHHLQPKLREHSLVSEGLTQVIGQDLSYQIKSKKTLSRGKKLLQSMRSSKDLFVIHEILNCPYLSDRSKR